MNPKREDQFTALHAMLRALADPTRLRIVGLLTGGEVCVCHIRDARHSAAQSLAASGLPSTVRSRRYAAGWTVGPLSACADRGSGGADAVRFSRSQRGTLGDDHPRSEKVGKGNRLYKSLRRDRIGPRL